MRSIINISSIYGVVGPQMDLYAGTEMGNPAAYAVSKAGLMQLTRWMSSNVAPYVRVNNIVLGGIERGQPESFLKKYNAKVPLERMATEEDVKGAIAFLSTELSSYMTGQSLFLDGGWTIV
nr:SDR family oxidoreductase [Pseudoalteromonas sp. H100]